MKHFSVSGENTSQKPYHYRACGLENIYLENGYTIEETDYGPGVTIHDVQGLHWAIGLHLILDKKLLSAREFRFLRKEMGFTQEKLAKYLQLDVQSIARYEKDQTAISGPADTAIRFIFAFHLLPDEKKLEVLDDLKEELADREKASDTEICFRHSGHVWEHGLC